MTINTLRAWAGVPTMQCELFILAMTCGRKGRWRQHDVDGMFGKMSVVLDLF